MRRLVGGRGGFHERAQHQQGTWKDRRRDIDFKQDAMRTRKGKAPQVMASLNNLALGILGRLGITDVVEAQRSLDYYIDCALHRLSASQVAP